MSCVRSRRGKWVLDFYDQDKTRRWITTKWPATEANRLLAEKELARHANAVEDCTFLSKTQQRDFAQLVDAWTAQLDVRPLTRADYQAVIKHHLSKFFGDSKLRAITRSEWKSFARGCKAAARACVPPTRRSLNCTR